MRSDVDHGEPKLQSPGAGLPFLQSLAARFWIGPYVSKQTSPTQVRERYDHVIEKLTRLVAEIPAEKRAIRVLVEPLMGLEDSSRYWSLNAVLDHLLIVSSAMEAGILSLAAGKLPDLKPDTATVKPKKFDQDMLPEFIARSVPLMKRLDDALSQPGMNFDSPLTLRHPWFGPMNARQWHWLLSAHLTVHYKQAKLIVRGLA